MQDGLPGLAIQCIYKDSRGLLWIGTQTGLSTFDGEQFSIIGKPEGLTATNIWSVTEDKHGNIWLAGVDDGVIKYDGKDYTYYNTKNGLASNRVRVLGYSEKFDCIVAGTYNGFSKITNDTIINFPQDKELRDSFGMVTGMADIGDFMYLTIYGKENPIRFFPSKNRFISLSEDEKYPVNSFGIFISSQSDTVFSKNFDGVRIFRKDKQIIDNSSMGQIFSITEDNDRNLWLASWSYPGRQMIDGVFKYDGLTFENYKTRFGITDKEIFTVFYDTQQDVLWIGTTNEGLFKVTFSGVEIYPASYFGLNKQKFNDVFVDSDNEIWVAGTTELIRMKQDGNYKFVDKHPRLSDFSKFWTKNNRSVRGQQDSIMLKAKAMSATQLNNFERIIDFNYQCITEDSSKNIFYTNRFGLFSLNLYTNQRRYLCPEGSTGGRFEIIGEDTLMTYGWGETLLNTRFRKDIKEIDDSAFVYFTETRDPFDVNQVVKKENTYWYVSKSKGLWMSQGMNLRQIFDNDSILAAQLNAICFYNKDHIILGSNTGEVYLGNYRSDSLKIAHVISRECGLLGNSVSWLYADENNLLWVGTNLGLNILSLDSLNAKGTCKIRQYDTEEGYLALAAQKAVPDKNGNLWFIQDDQLIKLNRRQFLNQSENSGQLVLTDIDINYKPTDEWTNIPLNFHDSKRKNSLLLKHDENNLALYFHVLNYKNPSKDHFQYYLEGFDEHSTDLDKNGKVVYSNLAPGNYTLKVNTVNLQTQQKSATLKILIKIRYPWWGLWYVQLLAAVILVSLLSYMVYSYARNKRRKLEQKQQIEKTIAELEIKALQAQMNPHFIFNSINGIQYYILDNKIDEVLEYLSDFSKVVRVTMEQVSQKWILLDREIEFLTSYLRLEQMRFSDKFDFKININQNEKHKGLKIPPLMIQPFLENSIRHGFKGLNRKGHISIRFELSGENEMKCIIEDNGIGREQAAKSTEEFLSETRQRSGAVTANRINLFNNPDQTAKYRVNYIDNNRRNGLTGLTVELVLPVKY